ncbi:variant erythrocyte surface antigen-1 family protein [Babesia caballi]|uniref:Variant erythrocyte surface antigen-1 family protein n=1 Tax=Babesia caballi TaxID=5871 RepID=A0AAV4LNL7_BABCB|nr:variant erythrocyte surface antigen-1 family protein [Babesia caballi]
MVDVQKSLTDPPTNLKEAIDWVIKIQSQGNAINDLAKELHELHKHDGSEVALKVLDKYRLVSKSVIKGLEDANTKMKNPKDKFYFTYTALNNLSQGLKPFVTGSQAHISPNAADNVGTWDLKVDKSDLKTLVNGLAGGLQTFQNGILQNPNDSADKSVTPLSSLTINDKRECAAILIGVMPVVYIGLTYLYWQCSGPNGWATKSPSQDEGFKQFLMAFGYADNLKSQNGGPIVSSVMNNIFSGELQTAYTKATSKQTPSQNENPSYPDFLETYGAGTLKNLIEQLTNGLKAFIGYGSGGQGIANVVHSLQQLRDGLVKFLYVFLGRLNSLNLNVHEAVTEFNKARMRTGSFENAIGSMSNITDGQIKGVVTALKNVGQLTRKDEVTEFAKEVSKYLGGVLNAVAEDEHVKNASANKDVTSVCQKLTALLDAVGKNQSDLESLIKNVKNANNTLNPKRNGDYIAKALIPAVASGIPYLLTQLNTEGYKSSYQPTSTWTSHFNSNSTKAAQIFLGCLPLYYYWLAYLYWKCKQTREMGDGRTWHLTAVVASP